MTRLVAKFPLACLAAIVMTSPGIARAAVKLPAVLGSHMVLQREVPLPVWGWAEPGEKITVTLGAASAVATAAPDGSWRVTLPPQTVGGPTELTVAGTTRITLTDLLFGDVWVCSGQSNMQFATNSARNAAEDIQKADLPRLRLFSVTLATANAPAADCQGTWQVCSPQTVPPFSAVGFFFGRELHQVLDVPIGLIATSWGGTIADAWTPLPAFDTDPDLALIAASFREVGLNYPRLKEEWPKKMAAWQELVWAKDEHNRGFDDEWAATEFDDGAWKTISLPTLWKTAGLPADGVVWCRQTVDLPADWEGEELHLELDTIETFDTAYFNGEKIGATGKDKPVAGNVSRQYKIPAKLVKAGPVALALRVVSAAGSGGFTGKAKQMRLTCPGKAGMNMALGGPWKAMVEQTFAAATPPPPAMPVSPEGPNHPTVLYNAMIHPLIPFGIKGAIWYQGESNASRAYQYRKLLPTMIRGWRTAWNQGDPATGKGRDFPFYIVQLANFTAVLPEPAESEWAELREAQSMTARNLVNTGIAVAIDIGDAADIHPRNKQEVGRRLALAALGQAYGKDLVLGGPLYESMAVEGDHIRLKFTQLGGGLSASGGEPLKGFAVAGADRKFVWAEATLDGATVVVRAAAVPQPVAVRYAWANNPVCNLANKENLPASPFRTDDWPGLTIDHK